MLGRWFLLPEKNSTCSIFHPMRADQKMDDRQRWFLSTRFDSRSIDPIAVALVAETGQEYYACLSDGWDPDRCSKHVLENVLPLLPSRQSPIWRSSAQVKADILAVCGNSDFWGYLCGGHWIALCRILGSSPDFSAGYCNDLAQEMRLAEVEIANLPASLAPELNGSPLSDARWNRRLYDYLFTQGSKL